MRTLSVFCAIIGMILTISCNKDEELGPGFDMMYQPDITIPAGIGIGVNHSFTISNISTNYQSYLNQFNKTDADIKRILVSQVNLRGVFGDADYGAIEVATLRIYKLNDPSDFIEIAYRDPTPLNPGNILALIPNETDIKRFMKEPRFNIDLRLRLRDITQMETDTRIELQFRAVF
jgi:hypothetical protein